MKAIKQPQVKFRDLGREMNCTFYPKDSPLPENLEKLAAFFDIWKNKFHDGSVPKWSDFSFEDFIGWHSNMRVMDIGGSLENHIKNLIIGEGFAKYLGKKTLYEVIKSGASIKKETIASYEEYLDYIYDHHYCISEGSIPDKYGTLLYFTWIDLPLMGDDNKITHIITAIQFKD